MWPAAPRVLSRNRKRTLGRRLRVVLLHYPLPLLRKYVTCCFFLLRYENLQDVFGGYISISWFSPFSSGPSRRSHHTYHEVWTTANGSFIWHIIHYNHVAFMNLHFYIITLEETSSKWLSSQSLDSLVIEIFNRKITYSIQPSTWRWRFQQVISKAREVQLRTANVSPKFTLCLKLNELLRWFLLCVRNYIEKVLKRERNFYFARQKSLEYIFSNYFCFLVRAVRTRYSPWVSLLQEECTMKKSICHWLTICRKR
mgnify:CR=1 FL=1